MKKIFILLLSIIILCNSFSVAALSVSARAAIVICGDTGEVLYAKNADIRMPMASTTKIMTALLLCEYGNLEREITVTEEMVAVEGSSMGLLPGDTVSLRALLYGMLLSSGNDAANTTAIVIGGSIDKFVQMMNAKAADLGLENTHFVTPSGLDADDHYTTAYDLSLLAKAAMQNEFFASAASCEYETLYYGNPPYKRTLKNHNKLLASFDGAIGVKTGFTKKSGRCLVSAAKRDGKFVIAVTLNAPDDWNDHNLLLEYGLNSLRTLNVDALDIRSIPVIGGTKKEADLVYESLTFSATENATLNTIVSLPHFLYAPIKKGETVGKIYYYCNDELIGEIPIKVKNSISHNNPSDFHFYKSILKYIFSNY